MGYMLRAGRTGVLFRTRPWFGTQIKWLPAEDKTIDPSPSVRPDGGSSSKVQSLFVGGASSSEVAAPCNLPIPRIAEAIVVSCPQSNSESLPSFAASSVVSRTLSSSGDAWGLSSNGVLSNEAGASDPFNGVLSVSLVNVVVPDEPFNGVPSLGEGESNDGADTRLGL